VTKTPGEIRVFLVYRVYDLHFLKLNNVKFKEVRAGEPRWVREINHGAYERARRFFTLDTLVCIRFGASFP
jgi:hypothetical protein